MKTTIDAAGRVAIPKKIRREAGLKPGMPLEVRWREGRIEIEPAPLPVKLVRKSRLLVAVPQKEASPLKTETVERTRRTLAFLDQLKAFRSRLRRKHGTINTLDILYEIREEQ